jgi:tRNA uridine 5-carboxymethylaminomethyl modification enzyme
MIDDLTTRGVVEPYRMFTSRAEFRLHLRSDNADQRLTALGVAAGLVGAERAALFGARDAALRAGRKQLDSLRVSANVARAAGIAVNGDGVARSAFALLSYPEVDTGAAIRVWPELAEMDADVLAQLAIDAQYAVYVDRQRADIEAVRRDEGREIPAWMDFGLIPGLSNECRQKLVAAQPGTIAQVQAVNGVTPAAVTLILSIIRRGHLAAAS